MDSPPPPLPASGPVEEALAHEGFVRALARGALGRDHRVEDVVSETLFAAARGGASRTIGRGWLSTVVRRRSLDVRRGERRRAAREAAVARADRVPATIDAVVAAETRRRVLAALHALDPIHREALVLRYDEGLPPRAMAVQLGVPVETARSRVKRGLELLRGRLGTGDEKDRRRAFAGLALLADRPPAPPPLPTRPLRDARWRRFVALAGAALLAGIWLLDGFGGEREVPSGSVASADGEPPAPSLPLASGGDERVPAPGAVPLRPGLAAAPPRPPPDPASVTGTGALVGRVRRDGRPLAARLELRRVADVPPEAVVDGSDPLDRDAWFRALAATTPPALTTASDAGGRYTFERVRPGAYEARVFPDGGAPQAFPLILLRDGERKETLLELPDGPASLVIEALRADGGPAAGAVAIASGSGWAWVRGDLPHRLDASGRARLERLPEGEATVFVWVDGEPAPREARVVLPTTDVLRVGPGGPRRPPAPGRVSGRVRLAGSRLPVPWVRVHATEARSAQETVTYPARSTSADAEGRFTLEGLGVGFVTVFVQGDGYLSVGMEKLWHYQPDPLAHRTDEVGTLEVDVEVVAVAPVAGRVVDEDGRPLRGATVRLESAPRVRFGGGGGPGTLPAGVLNAPMAAVTDADGRFALSAPIPGHPYVVGASSPGRRPESVPFLRAPPADEAPLLLTLALEEGDAWADVTVVDADSKARVPFARVTVWRPDGPGARRGIGEFQAGRDGVARVGPYRSLDGLLVTAEPTFSLRPGMHATAEPVPLLPSGTTAERPAPMSVLSIVVEAPEGRDLRATDLFVRPPGTDRALRVQGGVGADGKAEVHVAGPGPFLVVAILEGGGERLQGSATGAPDGAPLRVVLRPKAEGE